MEQVSIIGIGLVPAIHAAGILRHVSPKWMLGSSPMGWTPPPDGIAMCQGGVVFEPPEGGGIHGAG